MRIPAYAKINLFLDVMEKREDKFHNIRSIMHKVTLCDYVSAERHDDYGQQIVVACPSAEVPLGEDNLVFRAAKLFFEHFGINEYNVSFSIEKNIPVSAGLAGGSTDAAAALILLNDLFEVGATKNELCSVGAKLGSDIPFCLMDTTCLATGRGEVLTELESNLNLIFVIAKGGEGVSTPAAYKRIDEKFGSTLCENFADLDEAISAVKTGDATYVVKSMYNTFEDVVIPFHREAAEAKRIMLDGGAIGAMLSGSGPSVFGVFADTESASTVRDKLSELGYSAHLCFSL